MLTLFLFEYKIYAYNSNLYLSVIKFSKRQTNETFPIFRAVMFHAHCLQRSEDNLPEVSKHVFKKKKKKTFILPSTEGRKEQKKNP